MKFKPHHVAFTVKNLEESIAWYVENLGFSVFFQYNKHGMEIALLLLDQIKIELFCFGDKTKPLPEYRSELFEDLHVVGTKHLCIEVEDLDQMIENLKKKDIECREIDTAGFGGRYTFIKDCNGILIELYQA